MRTATTTTLSRLSTNAFSRRLREIKKEREKQRERERERDRERERERETNSFSLSLCFSHGLVQYFLLRLKQLVLLLL